MPDLSASAWWQRLPDDLHRQRERPVMDASHAASVRITAAFDRVLRLGADTLIASALARDMGLAAGAQAQRDLLRFYGSYADRGRAADVFPLPERPVRIQRRSLPQGRFLPRSARRERLHFDSGYRPLCPSVGSRYSARKRNGIAHAEYWSHADGPRPTLIFLHGFFASPYGFNSRFFCLPWFYQQGYDIVLCTLPFHGARRGRADLYSGQGYFSGGMALMNEAMLHAVYDVRVLMNFLQDRGVPSMGVSGLSLGGYLSALLASVDRRLAFSIPNSPVVAPVDMAMSWQATNALLRWSMRRHGLTLEELRQGTALHSPLTYEPVIDADRLLIISGAGDRFTPPRFVKLLHDHWTGSDLHWFPGNHVIHLQQGDYLRRMKRFMDRHTGL